MKMRKAIKKVVALTAGITMLGATIMGATASLADYPEPFVKNGQIGDTLVVVGSAAQTSDVVGAIDIAASLQAAAVSETSVTVSGSGVSVSGGKTEEVVIGTALNGEFGVLDDTDVAVLKDSKFSWNDETIDFEEKVTLNGVEVLNSADDEDFGTDLFLGTPSASSADFKYEYIIDDDDFDYNLVTEDEELNIEFLGKSIEITDVTNASNDEIVVSVSSKYFFNVGDSVVVEGKTVEVVGIGSAAISVNVDGENGVIENPGSEKINGIDIEIDSLFYVDEKEDRSATLKIGSSITETVKNGDSMEMFGEPDREADAEWIWIVEVSPSDETKLTLGAKFNQNYNSDTEPVKAMGEAFSLPNDFLKIYMDSTTVPTDLEVELEFDDGVTVDKTAAGADASAQYEDIKALVITASDNKLEFAIDGGTEESNVGYVVYAKNTNATEFAFENSDGDIQLATAMNLVYEDTTFGFTLLNGTALYEDIGINGPWVVGGDNLTLTANIIGKYFGGAEEEDAADIALAIPDFSTTTDKDVMTNYGVIIRNAEGGFDDETFTFVIPSEQVKVNVVVAGGDSAVTSSAGGSVTSEKVNAIGVGLGVLDSDVTVGSQNMIVVGGPCVNTAAAELMGNPANCAEGFEMGKAMIKLYESNGKTAMLVAGLTALDTQGATRVVSQYEKYDLSGSEASVVVTSLNSIKVE